MLYILLSLAFLLELVAWGSFAFMGTLLPLAHLEQVMTGIALFIGVIVFWSIYMSPKAPKKFGIKPYYTAKTLIYGVAAYVIYVKVSVLFCAMFVILALMDEMLLYKHNLK